MSNKVGGYTDFRLLAEEDKEVFKKATEGLVGVGYRPSAVSTKVISGTAYRFFCDATPVIPNPVDYLALVYIEKTIDGEIKISKIAKLTEE